MDILSLRHAKTKIKGQDGEVTIFEVNVMPSMKSEIYLVYFQWMRNTYMMH